MMHTDRLLKLAEFLATVPQARFDMGAWDKRYTLRERMTCGFAGCAMGWAAHAKLFPGLTLTIYPDGFFRGYRQIAYNGYLAYDAAQDLFGLSEADTLYLFSPKNYNMDADADDAVTPAAVAQRIRAYVTVRQIVESANDLREPIEATMLPQHDGSLGRGPTTP